MAILHNQILGLVSGAIKSLIFNHRNDVNFVYAKPSRKKLPMDTASVFRRDQFRFIGKLSKAIYQTPLLRAAWEKTKTNKTWCVYDDIFKANYRKIKLNDPDGIPALFPGSGFKLTNPRIHKTSDGYEFHTDGLGTMGSFDLLNAESISLIAVILYADPDLPDIPPAIEVVSFSTINTNHDLLSPLNIIMRLIGECKTCFTDYTIIKTFFTLALIDEGNNPVSFSEIMLI